MISFWLNQNIDDGSVLVHGPPQVVLDTIHLNERFVQMPLRSKPRGGFAGNVNSLAERTLWQRRYGSDRNLIGKAFALNGRSYDDNLDGNRRGSPQACHE